MTTGSDSTAHPSLSLLSPSLSVTDCCAAGKQLCRANHFVLAHLLPTETREVIKKEQYLNNESQVIRELQIKAMRYPLHLLEQPRFRTLSPPNAGQGAERQGLLQRRLQVRNTDPLVDGSRVSCEFFHHVSMIIPLGIYPNEPKTHVHSKASKDSCKRVI